MGASGYVGIQGMTPSNGEHAHPVMGRTVESGGHLIITRRRGQTRGAGPMPHGGRKGRRPGHATGGRKQRTHDMAPATTAPPPEALVQTVAERVRAGTAPAEVAVQIAEAAPA